MPRSDNANVPQSVEVWRSDKQAIIDVVVQGSGEIAKNRCANNVVLQATRSRMDNTIPKAAKARWEAKACSDLTLKNWRCRFSSL